MAVWEHSPGVNILENINWCIIRAERLSQVFPADHRLYVVSPYSCPRVLSDIY